MSSPAKACAAFVACTLGLVFSLGAQSLEWRSAVATSGSGQSTFIAVESADSAGARKVFAAGNASSNFQIGTLKLISLPSRPCGVVVGSTRDATSGTLTTNWHSRADSTQSATFTDIALIPGSDLLAVCGRFVRDITFKDELLDLITLPFVPSTAITLSPGAGTHGFIAVLDRRNGSWKSAFLTPDILPASIASDSPDSVVLTGQGTLAARFTLSNGSPAWKTSAPPATTRMAHIVARSGSRIFVLGEESASLPAQGVVLTALDPGTGTIAWTHRMGGPHTDTAAGLALDDAGLIHVVFHADYAQSTFASSPIVVPDPVAGDTLFTALIAPDGSLHRATPVSRPQPGGTLTCSDIAVDSTAATWLACSATGSWTLGDSPPANFSQTPLVIHVDPAGRTSGSFPAHGTQSGGAVRAIAIATPRSVITAGDYSGTTAPVFSPLPPLPAHLENGAFLASLETIANQQLWVTRPDPSEPSPLTVPAIRSLLALLGATVYAEVDADAGPKAVSFWGTPSIIATLLADPRIITTPEVHLVPNGVNPDPGWALARLGGSSSENASYSYLDSSNPVRLYLIDTAVANPGDWIGANPKLTLEKSILIRGSGDPTTSSQFKHGTQMLSLVGGLETGASPGTPVRVVNYDIYPQGGTTTTTLLAKAITEAVKDARNSSSPLPSAICIATSSATPATSYTLQSAIQSALAEGIPVIVSAGNHGASASSYIPAAYGSMNGVICTGASDPADQALPTSNYGSAVDLLAPGKDVRTLGPTTQPRIEWMTGTSPATALAAATALTEISANGKRTPADIENALKASAASVPSGPPLLRAMPPTPSGIAPPPASEIPPAGESPDGPVTDPSTPVALSADSSAFEETSNTSSPDSDSDGVSDLVETFHGSAPDQPTPLAHRSSVTLTTARDIRFTFPVARDLFDESRPFTLRNGCSWRIRCTNDLRSWSVPQGSLTKTTDTEGRLWLTASFPAGSEPSCFTRIEIVGPPVR